MFESLENVDWGLLHEQKLALLEMLEHQRDGSPEAEAISGIINLLDALQDDAADAGRWTFPGESGKAQRPSPSKRKPLAPGILRWRCPRCGAVESTSDDPLELAHTGVPLCGNCDQEMDPYRRGYRPASAPIERHVQGSAPLDYMWGHPDEYAPHPGEADFPGPAYLPYRPDLPCAAPQQMLGTVSELEPLPAPVEYDDLLMSDDSFEQAMREVDGPADILEPVPLDRDAMAEDIFAGEPSWPEPSLDQVMDEDATPVDALPGGFAPEGPADPEMADNPYADQPDGLEDIVDTAAEELGYYADQMDIGPLEQIAQDGMPAEPQPDQLQYEPDPMLDDPMFMDPWMMPGMGPPGFGPMGPMM